jgi:acyl carrier protein
VAVVAVVDLSEQEIQERLQAFVASEFAANREGAPVGLDDGLLAEGIIDSMGVMQLVSFIEETLGIVVDDEDIVPENFQSLRAVADLVAAKRDKAARPPG